MADESTTTLWAAQNALSVIVRERLVEYAERRVILAPLITIDDTGSVRGLVHRVDRWPDLSGSVSDLTEGTDIANTAITATSVAITPAVIGIGAEISDLLAGTTPFAGLDPFARQMANALAEELDDDVAGFFTTLNGGTAVGTTTVDATLNDFLDGLVVVQTNQTPGSLAAALHPRQAADLGISIGGFQTVGVDLDTGTGTSFTQPTGAGLANTQTAQFVDRLGLPSANGLAGMIAGVPVYVSPRCPTVNAGADRGGAIFGRDAITFARKWGVRVEMDRNIMGPNTWIAVTGAWGGAETADEFGVPFETDA